MSRLLARQVEVDTTHFLEGTALTAADRSIQREWAKARLLLPDMLRDD